MKNVSYIYDTIVLYMYTRLFASVREGRPSNMSKVNFKNSTVQKLEVLQAMMTSTSIYIIL